MDTLVRATAIAMLNELFANRAIAADVIDGPAVAEFLQERGVVFASQPLTTEQQIAGNQMITAPMAPGDDSILEQRDGAGDMFEQLGPPVVIKPYRRPKDPRVQGVLDAAEAERKAEAATEEPRKIFSDPRLDPNYKPPKFKR
jgi:hypothetical protein